MDADTRKLAGWIVAAVGLVIAVIGGFADQIGLGEEGPGEGFGGRQVAALVVGLVILAAGLGLALWTGRKGTDREPDSTPASPGEPS